MKNSGKEKAVPFGQMPAGKRLVSAKIRLQTIE
jgi:hypothetical protein